MIHILESESDSENLRYNASYFFCIWLKDMVEI